MENNKPIHQLLELLYPPERAAAILPEINRIVERHQIHTASRGKFSPDQKTAVLITYGDIIQEPELAPLATLRRFLLDYCRESIDTVHILPFFPYSSDDGFSVIDYRQVNPELGEWQDIRHLAKDFNLAFDLVINHISSRSPWFQAYLRNEDPYRDFFIESDPAADLSRVVRPRNLPLLTKFETEIGIRHLWTTFSADQIDLNFACPELLLEMIDILLFYVSQGASIIRLDAIAFLWKEIGTDCLHLPQTHAVVKLFRQILEASAPHVAILTETNVPHRENISYFGNGNNEAHMVYQFTLPPLTAHAILRQDAAILSEWAASLSLPPGNATFYNFLASHDGIGLRPAQGYLKENEIEFLVEKTRLRGGRVSMKSNPDGSQSPYELNISYYSLLADENETESINRFILAHSILMTMPGIPAIYFHSLVGSVNWNEGVEQNGQFRSINREKPSADKLRAELNNPNHRRTKIFSAIKNMLKLRSKNPALAPNANFAIQEYGSEIFAIRRFNDKEEIIAVHNLSNKTREIRLPEKKRDLMQASQDADNRWEIYPFQSRWLI